MREGPSPDGAVGQDRCHDPIAPPPCLDHLDDRRRARAHAGQLVRIRSVNDAGATDVEAPVAAVVADLMRGFGWAVTVTEVAPGRPNVVAVVEGAGPGRTLMFEGHSDVVTPGDAADWTFDPFAGDIVDGRLRGRGSADMKSGVAAMIHAARAVELAGFSRPDRRRGAGRRGGHDARRQALRRVPGRRGGIDGVIVCEPEGGEICPVAKGAIRLRVDLRGRMAHGAMPQIGLNPLPVVARLILGLAELRGAARRALPGPSRPRAVLPDPDRAAGRRARSRSTSSRRCASVCLDLRTMPGIDHRGLVDVVRMLAEPGRRRGRGDRARSPSSTTGRRSTPPGTHRSSGRWSAPTSWSASRRWSSAGCPAAPTAPS